MYLTVIRSIFCMESEFDLMGKFYLIYNNHIFRNYCVSIRFHFHQVAGKLNECQPFSPMFYTNRSSKVADIV